MSEDALTPHLQKIRDFFRNPDRRAAHRESAPVLAEMARDPEVLFSIVRRNLSLPDYLQRNRINPVLAMDIDKQADFDFIMHGWMPLPDRSTSISHQSIHHHGNLLLTSVSPFGPGYESILFEPGYQIDQESLNTRMKPQRFYHNPLHNLEFIETNTPHIVFYPPAVSITYALWCSEKANAASALKKFKFLQKYKSQAKQVLKSVGLAKAAGLNSDTFLDFCQVGPRIVAMRERVLYPVGSNENFVQNVFHFLQQIGFQDLEFLKNLAMPNSTAQKFRALFLKGEPINDCFEKNHLNIPKINLEKSAMLELFGLTELQLANQA